jgi:CD2 antigen cytoplasmic tail-binding protein 2
MEQEENDEEITIQEKENKENNNSDEEDEGEGYEEDEGEDNEKNKIQKAIEERYKKRMETKEEIKLSMTYSRDGEVLKSIEGEDNNRETRFIDKESNIMIEPFNLKQENEEGYYEKDGNYVLRKEVNDEMDKWADDLENEETNRLGRLLKTSNTDYTSNSITIKRVKPEDQSDKENLSEEELILRIIKIIKKGENIKEALKRLKPVKIEIEEKSEEKTKKKKQTKKYKLELSPDFNLLTDLSYHLSNTNISDVYSLKREDFLNLLDKKDNRLWEFKWAINEPNIHGPYSSIQIREWINNNLFDNYDIQIRNQKEKDIFDHEDKIDDEENNSFFKLSDIFIL